MDNLLSYSLFFLASYVFIFLRAFQQRNVAWLGYKWVIPTSLGMALTEFYVIVGVINEMAEGWHLLPLVFVGLGSGAGAMTAMWIHERFTNSNGRHTSANS